MHGKRFGGFGRVRDDAETAQTIFDPLEFLTGGHRQTPGDLGGQGSDYGRTLCTGFAHENGHGHLAGGNEAAIYQCATIVPLSSVPCIVSSFAIRKYRITVAKETCKLLS